MNPHALNSLLRVWPRDGAADPQQARWLARKATQLGCRVNPRVSRAQLRRAVCNVQQRSAALGLPSFRSAARLAAFRGAAVPWKYQRYLKPNQTARQQAIKIQPGATVPISFNGLETTMYVDQARRLTFRGKPWFIELKVKLSTEHVPIILTRESKCDCMYCGAPNRGEDSCRKCGAPSSC